MAIGEKAKTDGTAKNMQMARERSCWTGSHDDVNPELLCIYGMPETYL
jgi:hypothetical protein